LDVNYKSEIATLSSLDYAIDKVAFLHDGKRLINSGSRGIRIWDVKSGIIKDSISGHTFTVNKVNLSKDNKFIASAGDDGRIILWDFKTGWPLKVISGKSKYLQSVIFTQDGNSIISCSNGDTLIRVWDIMSGDEIKSFKGHDAAVSSLALNRDGDKLVSGSYDFTIKIWDVSTGKLLRNIFG